VSFCHLRGAAAQADGPVAAITRKLGRIALVHRVGGDDDHRRTDLLVGFDAMLKVKEMKSHGLRRADAVSDFTTNKARAASRSDSPSCAPQPMPRGSRWYGGNDADGSHSKC